MLLLRHSGFAHGHGCLSAAAWAAVRSSSRSNKVLCRSFSVMAARQRKDEAEASAIVVGAGAAGIATVGSLLENVDRGRVAWIDPKFHGGRINAKYREVPSNTKVGLFLSYAKALNPFQKVIEATPQPNAVSTLEGLEQDDTCSLHYAGDMLQMLSDGLRRNDRVDNVQGRVLSAIWDETKELWAVTIQGSEAGKPDCLTAPILVYCTGAKPITVPLPMSKRNLVDLDTALKPSELAEALPTDRPITIGVVGASHSAILVLMNLLNLAKASHPNLDIRWFTRQLNLKYAIYKDGWILYDNTGLKGRAAQFAEEQLNGEQLDVSEAGKYITRVDCSGGPAQEQSTMKRELPRCDLVVQAVGYAADELPAMKTDVEFDHETGGFRDKGTGESVKGLFGAGIAFPERVVDPAGNVEYAVGLFKFMKFLKRAVPQWVETARS